MKYDVIIIGAGPSGIFCAYELIRKNSNLKILMIEKGTDSDKGYPCKFEIDRVSDPSPRNGGRI